jgi:galactokinase
MLKLSETKEIDRIWISKFCQDVENEFIGVNCGIMDQFSVAMGLENSAILLDCNTLQYKYVSLNLNEYTLVIMNTNKKRELADSKYNERRSQCEEALSIINEHERIDNLCQATLEQINKYVADGMLKKRARHVVTENRRVHDAVSALDKGNLLKFANLLTQSHTSLKYDYEVTGFELDTIVEEALKFKGCLGARMTGAGFGGCAIALVFSDTVEKFKDKVSKEYQLKTNIIPSFYESKIGDGVKEYFVKAGTIYTS